MSKIDELIEQLCPEGVEFKELGDVCKIVGRIGFRGYTRSDLVDEDKGAISLSPSNIVNGQMKYDKCTYISWRKYEESPEIKVYVGDIVFCKTASIGKTALIKELPKEATINPQLVVLKEISCNNAYLSYLLKYDNFQKQINAIKGVGSVPTLTQNALSKLSIPIPPLPIQQEIVDILDKFTQLEAELEAELEERKRQYEYYRNQLLNFEGKEVEWKTLGEVGEFIRGNGLQKKDFTESGVGCIHYGQIYTYYGTYTYKTKSFVAPELAKKLQKVNKNDIIITNTSENIEDVCKTVVWLGDDEIVTGGHATIFKHNENPKYLAYYTQTSMFYAEKKKYASGTKVIDVSAKNLAKIKIPIPPLAEQERIVTILDKFDVLVNDISVGLPAEIKARRKQYEYYRGKLLDFKNINNG